MNEGRRREWVSRIWAEDDLERSSSHEPLLIACVWRQVNKKSEDPCTFLNIFSSEKAELVLSAPLQHRQLWKSSVGMDILRNVASYERKLNMKDRIEVISNIWWYSQNTRKRKKLKNGFLNRNCWSVLETLWAHSFKPWPPLCELYVKRRDLSPAF